MDHAGAKPSHLAALDQLLRTPLARLAVEREHGLDAVLTRIRSRESERTDALPAGGFNSCI
ncbi:hypothetical protein [Plantactinospora sp. KBS50]|uniref:hypothetical protein n=1 Tax=Plantactinospora sp. KBS50 TaxID=2024580 RepID=UPI0012FD8F1C|nr:hypothetical protein [Plantactinospora sp. KBS50]